MRKAARKIVTVRSKAISNATAASPVEGAFAEIVELIRAARQQAARAIDSGLIELYWRIGDYLHRKIESDGWATGTVVQLAAHIAQRELGQRGFSPQNLWRMRQFFVAYCGLPKLSTALRELQVDLDPLRQVRALDLATRTNQGLQNDKLRRRCIGQG